MNLGRGNTVDETVTREDLETLAQLLDSTDPRSYRLLVLQSNYRSPLSVTSDALDAAATAIERLLADRVVLCWLQVHYADIVFARAQSSNLQQREHQQRLQDRAQRRNLSAIRSLATVRRLLLPTAVQVNIGGQHLNVLDAGAAPVGKGR